MNRKKVLLRRGQSVLEYALLVCCICAAFLTMQYYMKRSIMGRMKQTSADISTDLYDTRSTHTNITHVVQSEYTTNVELTELGKDDDDFPILGIISSTTGTETNIRSGKEEIDEIIEM